MAAHYRLAKRRGFPHWYVIWSEGGRSCRRSTGTADRVQAEAVLAQVILETGRGPADQVGIGAVLQTYYDEHASKLPSAHQARIAIGHLSAHFSGRPVSIFVGPPGACTEYQAARRAANVSVSTVSRELSVLRAALRHAERGGLLDKAPNIPNPATVAPRERWLTRSEAARLLWASRKGPPYLKLFVRIALYTGARRDAVIKLQWSQVDLMNRRIDFTLPGRRETNKRRAVVPVGGALLRALERAYSERKGEALFPVASVRQPFYTATVRAKLPGVTPGVLRHTAATWMMMGGTSLWDGMAMLGHSRPTTFMRYAKHHPDFLQGAADAILRGRRAGENAPNVRQISRARKHGS